MTNATEPLLTRHQAIVLLRLYLLNGNGNKRVIVSTADVHEQPVERPQTPRTGELLHQLRKMGLVKWVGGWLLTDVGRELGRRYFISSATRELVADAKESESN